MEAKSVRFFDLAQCQEHDCTQPRTHGVVLEGVGWLEGRYCEKHAEQRARAVNEARREGAKT